MASTGIAGNLTKHLECTICLERYQEPKVLLCQHTYCRKCLGRLVTAAGRRHFDITCPECRTKTEIPGGNVKCLPTNFLVNNLLSELKGQPAPPPSCKKHEGELLKLFCQTCDQLICRDCALIDHRDHRYKFVKDVYPAERKKVEKAVDESRAKILALEKSLKTLNNQESEAQRNYNEVSSEVDSFINEQIKVLEKKRKSLKDDLKGLFRVQKQDRQAQKKSLTSSINTLKEDVEFANQVLRRGNKEGVLAAKRDIVKKLTGKKSATSTAKTQGKISYSLKVISPLKNEVVQKMAQINTSTGETYLNAHLRKREHSPSPVSSTMPRAKRAYRGGGEPDGYYDDDDDDSYYDSESSEYSDDYDDYEDDYYDDDYY